MLVRFQYYIQNIADSPEQAMQLRNLTNPLNGSEGVTRIAGNTIGRSGRDGRG